MRDDRRELFELAVRPFELFVALLEFARRHRECLLGAASFDGAHEELADGPHECDGLVGPRARRAPGLEPEESDSRIAGEHRQEQDRPHAVVLQCLDRALGGVVGIVDVGDVHDVAGAQRAQPEALRVDGQLRHRRGHLRDVRPPPFDVEVEDEVLVDLQRVRAVDAEVHAQRTETLLDGRGKFVEMHAEQSGGHRRDELLEPDPEPELGFGGAKPRFRFDTRIIQRGAVASWRLWFLGRRSCSPARTRGAIV